MFVNIRTCDPGTWNLTEGDLDTLCEFYVYVVSMSRSKRKLMTTRINLVVDAESFAEWSRAAAQSGLTLSAWVRLRCAGSVLEAMPPRKAA